MTAYSRSALFAAAVSAIAFASPAFAQSQDGTSGGVQGTDVSASTCGSGSTDASGVRVTGCADAAARDGTATTTSKARVNDRHGMQRSTATARDEDERARSMTHTRVRQGGEVRSRTMSMYKQRGERPVREVVTTGTPTPPKKKSPR